MNSEHDNTHPTVNGTEMEKKSTQRATPKDATPSQLEEILKHQKKEEELLEEQHELLQKKLLHDYDHYIKDLGSAQEKQFDLEIVDGDVNVKKSVATQDSRKIVQPSPVGTYDLSAPEIVPSYSIMYSGPSIGKPVILPPLPPLGGDYVWWEALWPNRGLRHVFLCKIRYSVTVPPSTQETVTTSNCQFVGST